MSQFKLSIPNPCSESWDKMEQSEQNKYCSKCQKCIIDFTNYSDEALVHFFDNTKEQICGRFSPKQLDRVLIYKNLNNQKKIIGISSLLLLSTFTAGKPLNDLPNIALTMAQYSAKKRLMTHDNQQLKGRVTHYKTQKPIQNAEVSVEQEGIKIATITDENGEFTFILNEKHKEKKLYIRVYAADYNMLGIYLIPQADANTIWQIELSKNDAPKIALTKEQYEAKNIKVEQDLPQNLSASNDTLYLNGRVTHCKTQKAIRDAEVYFEYDSIKISTITNEQGEFVLNLPKKYCDQSKHPYIIVHSAYYDMFNFYYFNEVDINTVWKISLTDADIVVIGYVIKKPTFWAKFKGLFKKKHNPCK